MKEVMVKITTNQVNEQGEEDIMEFVTEAKLYKRGEAVYLIYEETELSGIPGCRTRLKCKPDEVQMKRYGEGAGIGNEIRFERGRRYSGLYDTPFGAIELEVLTNRLENNLTEGGGNLDIDYSNSRKSLIEGHNHLSITLMY